MEEIAVKAWIYHSEWIGLMATIIICFLYVHHENTTLTKRLDDHITQINRRVDESNKRTDESNAQLNKRCDELHKEFYDLLKQMNTKT